MVATSIAGLQKQIFPVSTCSELEKKSDNQVDCRCSSRKRSRARNKNDSPSKENVSPNVYPHHQGFIDRNRATGPCSNSSTRKRGRPRKQTNSSITVNNDTSKCNSSLVDVCTQSYVVSDFHKCNLSTPNNTINSRTFQYITNNLLGDTRPNLQSREKYDDGGIGRNLHDHVTFTLTLRNCNVSTPSNYSREDLTNDEHAIHDTLSDDGREVVFDEEYLSYDSVEGFPSEYLNLGPPTEVCELCGALMWKEERNNKGQKGKKFTFSMCCKVGELKLPPQKHTPDYLKWLYLNSDHFRNNVRVYSSIFSFTSTGGIVDHNINKSRGPYCYRINGQNIHLPGSLLPHDGRAPKFCQLYIYDTENEVDNRIGALCGESTLDPHIVDGLMKMLDENNELAKGFRMARDRFQEYGLEELKLIFISSKSASGRLNHIGPSNEVGALLVGASDDHTCAAERDIVVQSKEGGLRRISTYISTR
ncbi:hypothetical protein OROGR_016100 [Orobanche gracilis]